VTALGAVVTALLPDYGVLRAEKRAIPGSDFADALEILRVLIHSQRRAETPDARRICERARVPRETCEAILERLAEAGWASRVTGWRWVLSCDPGRVTLAEVYRCFVVEPERLLERAGDGAPRELLGKIAADIEEDMAAPIQSLAEESEDGEVSRLPSAPGKTARPAHEEAHRSTRAERRR
jgi:membrane protein